MDFNEVLTNVSDGTLALTKDDVVALILAAATKDEHIDCDMLKAVIKDVQAVKKTAAEDFNEVKKAREKASKSEKAITGAEYVATLSEGDGVSYRMANGTVIEGTLGEIKEGTKRCPVVISDELKEQLGRKSNKSYIEFSQIIVPEDFVATEKEEVVA